MAQFVVIEMSLNRSKTFRRSGHFGSIFWNANHLMPVPKKSFAPY